MAAGLLQGRTVLLVTHDAAEASRLGHRILLMAPDGLAEAAAPEATPPRDFDAPETLACQGRLLRMMMQAA